MLAAHNRTATQDLAFAESRKIGTARGVILQAVREAGAGGVSCWRLERRLQMAHQTAGAALNALRRRGLVHDSGRRDVAPSGCKAILWVAGDGSPDPGLRPTSAQRLRAALLALEGLARQAPPGPEKEAAARVLLAEGFWP